jgi:hypothetical protein
MQVAVVCRYAVASDVQQKEIVTFLVCKESLYGFHDQEIRLIRKYLDLESAYVRVSKNSAKALGVSHCGGERLQGGVLIIVSGDDQRTFPIVHILFSGRLQIRMCTNKSVDQTPLFFSGRTLELYFVNS